MDVILIAAMTRDRVIGKDNRMPWHIPEEFKHFRRLTTGHTLVMGRKTFESVGRLPKRNTIVVSRSLPVETKGVDVCRTLDEAIEKARSYGKDILIAGGAEIYRQALPLADKLDLSYVKKDYDGDTYFPEFDEREWEVVREEDHPDFVFVEYRRSK
ncbi:MAG: dihydrofolate reductase [Candidatus Latescibacteria bacterium]|nr:dihydrofolate reductase [Candidatus Latescibacterota bacterium]